MAKDTHELDLPLRSNIDSIRVTHYNLELTCDIQHEIFYGSVVLVVIPVNAPSVNLSNAETVKRSDALELVNSSKSCLELSEANERHTTSELLKTTLTKCKHKDRCCVYQEGAEVSVRSNILQTHKENKKDAGQDTVTYNFDKTVTYNFDKTESGNSSFNLARTNVEQNALVSCFKDSAGSGNVVSKISELPDKSFTELCEGTSNKEETCTAPDFEMVLDSWDLHVTSVHEINVLDSFNCDINELCKVDKGKLKELFDECDKNPIMFVSEKTSLKFWKPGIKHAQHFPKCIRISYQTKPCGSSLKWTKDQDGRPCVFTHGHWINNRSLFPSQDVPEALATWQAYIHVPKDMTVLMSGDQNPQIINTQDLNTYIYQTNLVVPSSTLALAVGCWTEVEIIPCIGSSSSQKQLPCRLFTPKMHQYLASNLMGSYIPKCMEAAFSVLGSHPFMRLDILIVPASFSSLGMASPSLLFLSQSVLSNDGHMLIRVAHEISHSWFGLAIGPRDWHEEWLSEGFCTYTESVIHSRANQMTHEEFIEEREIYDHLKRRVLEAEVETISSDLQTLRYSRGGDENGLKAGDDVMENDAKCGSNDDNCVKKDGNGVKYVNNGMNPDKGFLQLHYIKGYFLLRFLEDLVGHTVFLNFLKCLVETFHHTLIDSMDVLRLFFNKFPDKRSPAVSEDTILRDWLNSSGLPQITGSGFESNRLVAEVFALESQVSECNQIWTKLHWRKRRKVDVACFLKVPNLRVVQLLLFLDIILERKKIHPEILNHLNKKFGLAHSNADVKHKWCELVVRYRLQENYHDVRDFLTQNQAMGVYLFGELIISRDGKQRKLAEECFTSICDDMEEGVKKVVQTMIFGS